MADDLVDYAAPGLRWGLIREDHPNVRAEFGIDTAANLGLPPQAAAPDEEFVYARIVFADPTLEPVLGYKPWTMQVRGKDNKMRTVNVEHPTDQYRTLCTKALGRALKDAGYPDDLNDLKSLMFWRQRRAELAALGHGATVQLDGGNVAQALAASAKRDPEAVGPDDGAPAAISAGEPQALPPEPDEDGAPSPETLTGMRSTISALSSEHSKKLTKWCRDQGWRVSRPETEAQARAITIEALALRDAPVDPETGEVATTPLAARVAAAVEGLNEQEQRSFGAFCQQRLEVTAGFTAWDDLDDEKLAEALAWLEMEDDPT